MRIPANPTSIRLLAARTPSTRAPRTRIASALPSRRRVVSVVASALAASLLVVAAKTETARSAGASGDASGPAAGIQTRSRPNVILIVTDDQRAGTLHVMPAVRRRIAARGGTFTNALVTNPLCCPSRATILTGQYSHSTRVYANYAPLGGWPVFARSGAERRTIAAALDAAGYRTALIGKYLNHYSEAPPRYVPPGWDRWFVFAQENGAFYNYKAFDNDTGFHRYGSAPSDYSTDVIRRKSVRFIRNTPNRTPFFLMVTPYAPHEPAIAAPRHEGRFATSPISLGPGFGEDVSDKPPYLRGQPAPSPDLMVARTRDQWESLLAVDQMVDRIFTVLAASGRVKDTLFIFTSDHGISNGEHRWRHKINPYEESIRIPLVVRFTNGGIRPGSTSTALAANVDLAPTIADFTGVRLPEAEGRSLREVLTGRTSEIRNGLVLEHATALGTEVPGYCGLRTHRFMYARYAGGFEELYDLVADPHELQNVARVPAYDAMRSGLLARVEMLCAPRPPGYAFPA
jgi:arylsulfatase A-like enzyme